VRHFRTVLNLLFSFAIARSYAADDPVAGVERVKVNGGEIEIYSPPELQRLLAAASQKNALGPAKIASPHCAHRNKTQATSSCSQQGKVGKPHDSR